MLLVGRVARSTLLSIDRLVDRSIQSVARSTLLCKNRESDFLHKRKKVYGQEKKKKKKEAYGHNIHYRQNQTRCNLKYFINIRYDLWQRRRKLVVIKSRL
jgi:hypothetical protein